MKLLDSLLKKINIEISDSQLDMFNRYYELLIEWNSFMNLTAITEKNDVIIKHFIDSIILIKYADISDYKILDLGTGAGFPGIPLKIMCESADIVLMDSLNKRIRFLDKVISELGLSGICAVHGRAEDMASDKSYRESFDFCISRAVAGLSVLSEYCLPFVKVGGTFISYKAESADAELKESSAAVELLGGRYDKTERYYLPETDISRTLIFIDKINSTPKKYPRRAGIPSKEPLK